MAYSITLSRWWLRLYIYIHTYVCKHIRNISPRNMWTLPSHHIYSWHLPIRSVLSCSIQFYPSTRSQSSRHPILRQRRAEVAFHQLEGRSQTALVEEGFEEGQAKDAAHAFWILSCGWWGHPSHPGYPGGVILRYSKILFQVYEVYYIIFLYIYIYNPMRIRLVVGPWWATHWCFQGLTSFKPWFWGRYQILFPHGDGLIPKILIFDDLEK